MEWNISVLLKCICWKSEGKLSSWHATNPIFVRFLSIWQEKKCMPSPGFEPQTSCMWSQCANHSATATSYRINSSFFIKKEKSTLAVVNVEIALVEMKTAQVEVEAQIQIRTSRYEIAKVKVEVQHMLNHSWIFPIIQFLLDYLCFELGYLFGQFWIM